MSAPSRNTHPIALRPLLAMRQDFPGSRPQSTLYLLFLAGFFFVPSSKWHNNFYYALVLAPFVLSLRWERLSLILRSKIFVSAFAYLSYLALTLSWSGGAGLDDLTDQVFHLVHVLVFVLLAVDLCLRDPACPDGVYRWLCASSAVGGVLSLAFFYGAHPFPETRLQGLGRLENPIGAATVYGMLGLLAYFHFIHRAEAIWRERRYYWAVLVICLAVMVFTQSRGPLLALAVTLLATAVYQRDARSTIILIVPLVFYVLAFLGAPEQILSPLTRYGGDSFRIEIWSQALEQIRKAPWLGHGITTVANYETSIGRVETHPHNVFLASLLYGGLLALLILLILVFLALRQGLRTLLAGGDPTLAVLLLFSIACQMTDGHRLLTNPKPVWLFFWLPVALACAAELQGKSGLSSPKEGPATSSRGACR